MSNGDLIMFAGSQMRKRSHDARTTSKHDFVSPSSKAVKTPTKLILVSTLLLVLLTISLLLAYFGRRTWNPLSSWTIDFNRTIEDEDDRSLSRLHPENHIFRRPGTVKHSWRVTSGLRRPDGVLKRVYLINGLFPGPTVEARSGDHITIQVENALAGEGLSMHWHGLFMRGANDMDGTVGITNDPIAPGEAFTYDFQIEAGQHGTFFYHSHDGLQRAEGLYGAFIIHDSRKESRKANARSKHHLLMAGDWYHRTAEDALNFYAHPGSFGNEAVPDSLLLNGCGAFNCSNAVPARPLDCQAHSLQDLPRLSLDARTQNILHVINVGTYAGLSISVPDAILTPFTVDGGNAIIGNPAKSIGHLQPGERVDILVRPLGEKGLQTSMLGIAIDTTPFKYLNPALTPSQHYPLKWEHSLRDDADPAEEIMDIFDLRNAKAAQSQSSSLATTPDETIVFYALTQRLAHLENAPRGFINNTFWSPQSPPLISSSRDLWNDNQFVTYIKYNQKKPRWIDIIINNLDEESHPFHLHGNDFWVLSTHSSTFNWGSYNPFEDEEPPGGAYDIDRPVKKDTVNIPRRGYAVLRFRADNPGFWLFHCHVLWHQASGMAMTFEVGV